MKKRYRFLLPFIFLGSIMAPTSSLAENRKKPPRRVGRVQAARGERVNPLDTLRTFTIQRPQGTQQSQNQNATPTATPPPSAVAAPQGAQQPQNQHVTIQATPPAVPAQQNTSTAPTTNRGTQPRKGRYTFRESQAVLTGKRRSIHEVSTKMRRNQHATPVATPPPPPREAEKTQATQQSSEQKTSTAATINNPLVAPASSKPTASITHNPFARPVPSCEDTTNSQSVENNSLNQAEQPAISQSQEQQTPPTSQATSNGTTTDWDDLFSDPVIGLDHLDLNELEQLNEMIPTPTAPSTESQQQVSSTSNNTNPDGRAVNNNQAQAPNPSSTMSVKRGIALFQGSNIVPDENSRPSPEDREMAADAAHEVLLDLNAIYHYEGDGSTGSISKFSSRFGQKLFAWLKDNPFANFRKESDKEAMRAFAQKLLAKFEGDADFRRECEMLEENFIQKQEDYQTNCARACMQVVSLFLHPETV